MPLDFVKRVAPSFLIPLFLGVLSGGSASAQRPVLIVDWECQKIIGRPFFRMNAQDIVVGRQIYRSTYSAKLVSDGWFDDIYESRERHEMVCKLPNGAQTLAMTLMLDERYGDPNGALTFNVYVDGENRGRTTIRRGEIRELRADLRGGRSLAIEILGYVSNFLYASQAQIEVSPVPGRRP